MTVKHEKNKFDESGIIRLGTRGSPLALVQANIVKDEILKQKPSFNVEIIKITTSGDWRPEQGETRLKEEDGGKGQFAKEIEVALLDNEIDIAVHSMKDMETNQPEGLEIAYILPREDVRDAFISNKAQAFTNLSKGAVVGTSSVRRAAILKNRRPDLKVVPIRGNVKTRIDKMIGGQVEATFLAYAGLKRLGMTDQVASIISIDDFLPSAGQGAIGIEIRNVDRESLSFISRFSCLKTFICVECERAILRELDGSCHTPIGVYVMKQDEKHRIRVSILSEDGQFMLKEDIRASFYNVDEARQQGALIAKALKPQIPDGIL